MKKLNLVFCLYFITISAFTQEVKPVKNLIVMIPDGTSIGVYSAARWYNYYNGKGDTLNVDPYLTGTVTTFSSTAPIADSAPSASPYVTSLLQQGGNVSIYPEPSANDLYAVDASRMYEAADTIVEDSHIENLTA